MKKIRLNDKGKLTVLQVSDPQDMHFVRKTMPYMLAKAYDSVKPDLVIFTGDNILGNHLCDKRFGSGQKKLSYSEEYENMKKALSFILAPLEDRNIPFAMIFGNHDDMNRITKQDQLDIYRSYSCFVEGEAGSVGNSVIPVYDSLGEDIVYSLWLFDSSRYNKEDRTCEQTVTPDAVEYFTLKSAELNKLSKTGNVPSLAFVHIPLPCTLEILKESENGIEGPDGKKYIIDREKGSGTLTEYPSVMQNDNGLFEKMKDNGNVKAVIFGHDHPNNFRANVDGIDIIQTSCASFRCYGNKKLRGVRAFELEPFTEKTYYSRFLSYEDLCGSGTVSSIRYFLDADEYEKKKAAVLSSAFLAVSAAITVAAGKAFKRSK